MCTPNSAMIPRITADETLSSDPCRITFNEIKMPDLPESTISFASKMGPQNLMRSPEGEGDLRHHWPRGKTGHAAQAMDDSLFKHYPFEMPGPSSMNKVKRVSENPPV